MKASFLELLSPAGSPAALDAALENGADAVYLGASAFNARINAQNFTKEDLKAGIRRAHALGRSIYMTLNTQALDRELPALLDTARDAYDAGVDALIVADLGAAREIHRILPALPLHASTQMSGHNTDIGRLLSHLGFTRMVIARETAESDIRSFCENSPLECEVFVHGALCVSHSGQCLFSSVVGGRSGNRGACAQPCRLPYKNGYPLSLRDLCLAREIPKLKEMGVASLKIEGRMKSPEYVGAVTAVYRRLIDENRAATDDEIAHLAEVFSRSGFTDGYFHSRVGKNMLGVRSDSDKEHSRALPPFKGLTKKAPITLSFTAKENERVTLTAEKNSRTVAVTGEAPILAEKSPTDEATVVRQLSKLGGTIYTAENVSVSLEGDFLLPISQLNALRREAVTALETVDGEPLLPRTEIPFSLPIAAETTETQENEKSARFISPAQITNKACDYFDICYLPLFSFTDRANGVILPPVVYDGKRSEVKVALIRALKNGASHVLITNLGQLSLVREATIECAAKNIKLCGDFRLGVTNASACSLLRSVGLDSILLSPELSLPQARDIARKTPITLIVYGRLPLMLLEKCVNLGKDEKKTAALCSACKENAKDPARSYLPSSTLTDRRGTDFPVLREWEHRSVIYNSLPTYMADRLGELLAARISNHHYIFSIESPTEIDHIINSYERGLPPKGDIRRLPN